MKTEKDIRFLIGQIKQDFEHVLKGSPATFKINLPRAIMQITALERLQILYWILEEHFVHKWDKEKPNT